MYWQNNTTAKQRKSSWFILQTDMCLDAWSRPNWHTRVRSMYNLLLNCHFSFAMLRDITDAQCYNNYLFSDTRYPDKYNVVGLIFRACHRLCIIWPQCLEVLENWSATTDARSLSDCETAVKWLQNIWVLFRLLYIVSRSTKFRGLTKCWHSHLLVSRNGKYFLIWSTYKPCFRAF